jgi:hypothetical protein
MQGGVGIQEVSMAKVRDDPAKTPRTKENKVVNKEGGLVDKLIKQGRDALDNVAKAKTGPAPQETARRWWWPWRR